MKNIFGILTKKKNYLLFNWSRFVVSSKYRLILDVFLGI